MNNSKVYVMSLTHLASLSLCCCSQALVPLVSLLLRSYTVMVDFRMVVLMGNSECRMTSQQVTCSGCVQMQICALMSSAAGSLVQCAQCWVPWCHTSSYCIMPFAISYWATIHCTANLCNLAKAAQTGQWLPSLRRGFVHSYFMACAHSLWSDCNIGRSKAVMPTCTVTCSVNRPAVNRD